MHQGRLTSGLHLRSESARAAVEVRGRVGLPVVLVVPELGRRLLHRHLPLAARAPEDLARRSGVLPRHLVHELRGAHPEGLLRALEVLLC